MEALPDLATLSDTELRDLIRTLLKEEQEVSYRRRLLHGKIDILRAELVSRLQKQVETGSQYLTFETADTGAWQKGDYRAEVWIGDEKVNTQQFQIVDADDAAM